MKGLAIIGILAVGSTVNATSISFAKFGPGEKIRVRFESRGCYNHGVMICEVSGGKKIVLTCDNRKGRTTVSEREARGLDTLFDFYRSRPRGGCTTRDQIEVEYFRGTHKIGRESFVDASCFVEIAEQAHGNPELAKDFPEARKLEGITSLTSIASRIKR
jgi:hypothetical protein